MARVSPFSGKVLRKAAPALLLALGIFISLLFVVEYTESVYLVILLWIVIPVVVVQLYRKIRDWLKPKTE